MNRVVTTLAALAAATPAVAHEGGATAHLHPHGIGIALLGGLLLLAVFSAAFFGSSKKR